MKKTKELPPKKVYEFDATKYEWERLDDAKIRAFGISCAIGNCYAVKDVDFHYENLLELKHSYKIGIPHGVINKYAAILLNDNSIIFCLVEGQEYGDSFNSGDKISMQYYKLTPI